MGSLVYHRNQSLYSEVTQGSTRRFAESALGASPVGSYRIGIRGGEERIGSPLPMPELASRERNETSSVRTLHCAGHVREESKLSNSPLPQALIFKLPRQ